MPPCLIRRIVNDEVYRFVFRECNVNLSIRLDVLNSVYAAFVRLKRLTAYAGLNGIPISAINRK